ncbi:MAG: outer membrane lipoprotein carrier protein LolA [Hydrogenophaga sp.]|uniref:LolA-related protein n=1 Tax=Hydrogenophaga sp. TaxID=1904254 RepID=UPI001DCD2CA5|nr:LolA-related protein [Hydrogenophaga sp.]MBX3609930.1 outer membrane lipoprotein carrier protein LolA [Hydrogenophaga sp.]
MRFRLLLSLVLLLMAPLAQAQDLLDQLMARLATNAGGTVRFVELRHLAMLDAPLRSTGEMIYNPPDWLERRTLRPRAERVLLYKDTITIERERTRMSVQIAQRPEVQAFVASIRSTLRGDRAGLERHYKLQLQGSLRRWTLVLEPIEPAMRAIVTRITLNGDDINVRHIEYAQADGDRTELQLEPMVTR